MFTEYPSIVIIALVVVVVVLLRVAAEGALALAMIAAAATRAAVRVFGSMLFLTALGALLLYLTYFR